MAALYDEIGVNYATTRQPDPHIAALIAEALGPARTVLNVGAGAGSYEPVGRKVVAVEPSLRMIRQRPAGSAPVLRGVGEMLPFADGSFDSVLASLTIHHWPDRRRGFAEMLRVALDRVVVFTFDPAVSHQFWLVQEYFPGIAPLYTDSFSFEEVQGELGGEVQVVPVPADCTDGFLGAYWRRPERYLDPPVRAGISAFHGLTQSEVAAGLQALERDLDSGEWHRRHRDLLRQESFDGGYRLIVHQK
jgi:SAM-dependent methyltransferase